MLREPLAVLAASQVLGIDCLLKDHHSGLRDLDPVMCLSYVYVACISRDTMIELSRDYPQAAKTLEMASRHMTIRAALIIYYRKFVRHNRKLPGKIDFEEMTINGF